MIDQHTARCTASCCDCKLTDDDRQMTMELDNGKRHAYECACGAITITVAKKQ